MNAKLTIGPILFHWPAEQKRDFYFRMADEAPVDRVYIGEVVCGKRVPFFEKYYGDVSERLQKAGKEVVFSTLSEVMIKHDRKIVESMCALEDGMIEANDASALWYLSGRPHAVGPFVNAYNEDTLAFLSEHGAVHVTLPPELPADSIKVMGKKAQSLDITLEMQVFGRIPLALSARCYHARAHGRIKDNCRFICEEDPDGMDLRTVDHQTFLTVNGIQTLSYKCLNLMNEMEEMKKTGVSAFRLSPHGHDMVRTARLFRAVLDFEYTPEEATKRLMETGLNMPFANGFYHRAEGYKWIEPEGAAVAAE
jgi:O2-independent ubiquinone biosynthesis protein UbiV